MQKDGLISYREVTGKYNKNRLLINFIEDLPHLAEKTAAFVKGGQKQ